ncbi:TldD/PmbA family protein [bacterium]|nr:TldD/PmbA family protein [bacterium]
MDYSGFAKDIIKKVVDRGADEVDVYLSVGRKFSVDVHDGDVDKLDQSGTRGLGIRLFSKKRLAFASTSDFQEKSIDTLIDELFGLVQASESNENNGLPDQSYYPDQLPDLQLFDEHLENISFEERLELAKTAEASARTADPRIKYFRKTSFLDWVGETYLINSAGLNLKKMDSYCYLLTIPIAEENDQKQMGSYYKISRFLKDLYPAEHIGTIAAQRALRQLGARPVKTTQAPVVFEPDCASRFLEEISSAFFGSAKNQNSTFLMDKLGQKISSELLTLIDDGSIPRGLNTSPFDGEGVRTGQTCLVRNGVLENFIYNCFHARKGGTKPTGNATREYNTLPGIGTSNLYMSAGQQSPEEIIAGVDEGLYLTDTMGSGLDITSGSFSFGAQGLWISKGKLTFPVSSITIAGTLQELLNSIDAVGNDLIVRNSTYAPTFRVSKLNIGGE